MTARNRQPDRLHPSHVTRISMSASSYDEVCVNCGARDTLGSWGDLAYPCPNPPKANPNKENPND